MFSFWKSKPSLITLAKEGYLAGVRDKIARGKDLNKQNEVKYFHSFPALLTLKGILQTIIIIIIIIIITIFFLVICVYEYMYLCVYVCMYVCMYVCICMIVGTEGEVDVTHTCIHARFI